MSRNPTTGSEGPDEESLIGPRVSSPAKPKVLTEHGVITAYNSGSFILKICCGRRGKRKCSFNVKPAVCLPDVDAAAVQGEKRKREADDEGDDDDDDE